MRHKVKGRKLGRTTAHRKATLQALSIALVTEHRIQTTVAKAKELRSFVEPLITRAKTDTTHNRRQVFAALQDKYAVQELFDEIGPKAADRPGGYTRVIKTGIRSGDASEMALIELVDYNDVPPEAGKSEKKRTRRAGRSNKPTGSEPEQKSTKADADKGTPVEEAAVAEESADEGAAETTTVDTAAEETREEDSSSAEERSDAYNVDEVKERLDGMSAEEAEEFAGSDERVTVQKALDKIRDAASDEDTEEEK